MTFEESLAQFVGNLEKQYGIRDGVVKIGISYDLYETVIREAAHKTRYWRFADLSEPKFLGVAIVPRDREREKF